jgi:dTDP-glucose 4,6-dehydratase
MSRRAIVTGGAGFIGSAVVRFLLNDTDCEVLNLDKLTYAADLHSLAEAESNPRYKFVMGDINDRQLVRRLLAEFKPDLILHLAAESHVDRSIDDPSAFVVTNVLGTFSMLHETLAYWQSQPLAKRNSFRFCHVSTDEVFGSLDAVDPAFDERTRYDPNSPYAASKAGSDHLARAWHRTYGLPVVLSNCCNNYGAYQFPEKLIPLIILKALHGEKIPVYGRGENIRDWIYVDDHTRALWTIANSGKIGETYLVGSRCERRNIDVVRTIIRILDELAPSEEGSREHLISFVSDRPGHDFRYAICSDRITQELGWQPREDFESGLRKTVEWYLNHRQWWEPIRARKYQGERLGLSSTSVPDPGVSAETV